MASRVEEKVRRMDLRRETGTRAVPKRVPPPKANAHLSAHACFVCRQSFKVKATDDGTPRICPRCGGPLHWMGRSFKAPPRSDEDAWLTVQRLVAHGFRFFSYRSYDCAPLPTRARDVATFVREHPDHPFRVRPYDDALMPKRTR